MLVLLSSLAVYVALLPGPRTVGGTVFDIHTLLFAQGGVVLGALGLSAGVAVRLFGMREGLLQTHALLERARRSPVLELGSLAGLAMVLVGLGTGVMAFSQWATTGFGQLIPGGVIREVSISTLLFVLGGVVLMTSLLFGFLSLPTRRGET